MTRNCRYEDSLQLVQFYNATNGPNWSIKWNLNQPINTWHRVTLTPEGCVMRVEIGNNLVSGTLPNINLPNVEIFAIPGNALKGNIPTFNCPKLIQLNLDNNQLTGSIPNFNLPQLNVLSLQQNQLTGAIPSFQLPKLTHLFLTLNQLTGSLPSFNLPEITSMDLSSNRITGTIPRFTTPKLINLQLQRNQLTGSIPDLTLPNLAYLILSDNQLSGCIPRSLQSFCGKTVDLNRNPNLATQDFAAFCKSSTGACPPISTGGYCESKGTLPWEHWIKKISFLVTDTNRVLGGSSHYSSAKEGYGNFTNLPPAQMVRGLGSLVTFVPESSWANNPLNAKMFWSIWVDWNQDNDFEDAGEQVVRRGVTYYQGVFLDNETIFQVPVTAQLGKTRMRVAMKVGDYPLPCETFEKGEVEDYMVNIINPSPPSQALFGITPLNTMVYDQKEVPNFTIFPNPTAAEAFLDLKDFENLNVEIVISDVAGKVLSKQNIAKASLLPHRLDVSQLGKGTYFVQAQSIGKSTVTRTLYIIN